MPIETQTRITRKFGLAVRDSVIGALLARFKRRLDKEIMKENNELIKELNNELFAYVREKGITDPIRVKIRFDVDVNGKITKIEIYKIEVYKLTDELDVDIRVPK